MFGRPLGGGSNLTQRLHGSTLGSNDRVFGAGVGFATAQEVPHSKIIFGGLAPGSEKVAMPPPAITGLSTPRLKTTPGKAESIATDERDKLCRPQSEERMDIGSDINFLEKLQEEKLMAIFRGKTVKVTVKVNDDDAR